MIPPRPSLILAALILAAAASAQAQPAVPEAPAASEPLPDPAPTPPAAAPPAPAQLAAPLPHGPAPVPAEPPLALPSGIRPLPAGGWRLRLTPEGRVPEDPAVQAGLAEIGRRLAGREGRVSVVAQAGGPAEDISAARRTSLARALAVKQALAAGGLAETRIDVRPMGRTAEATDAVDILPPEASSGAQSARPAR